MSEEENKAVTAVKTVGLISTIFGLLEKGAIVLFMMFMERSKIKQKKSEDEKAKAESDTAILKKEIAIDKAADAKSDAEIIDDFLDSKLGDASGKSAGNKPD